MGKPIPEALAHLATLMPDGRVALSIADPDNPDRYLEVRGRVIERTLHGAEAHLDSLSRKYMGTVYPERRAGEQAVTFCIEPDHFTFMD